MLRKGCMIMTSKLIASLLLLAWTHPVVTADRGVLDAIAYNGLSAEQQ